MQWSVPNGSVGAVPRAWKMQRALRHVSKVTPTEAGTVGGERCGVEIQGWYLLGIMEWHTA